MPSDAPWADLPLLVTSPNGGGLVLLHGGEAMVLDRRDHTALQWEAGRFVRAIVTPPVCRLEWRGADGTLRNQTMVGGMDDVHDALWFDGDLHLVSTSRNEILRLDPGGGLRQRWGFPGEGDAWHLNCLAVWQGRLVASAFGEFPDHRGYKGRTRSAGFVFDLDSGERLWSGLSQPHTPFQDGDTLYVCDSENHRVLWRRGTEEGALEFEAYTRGLAAAGDWLFVGLSQSRNTASQGQNGAVAVIERGSHRRLATLPLPFREVYAIAPLPEPAWLSLLAIPTRERDGLLNDLAACREELRRAQEAEVALARLQRHPVLGRLIKVWRWLRQDPGFGRTPL